MAVFHGRSRSFALKLKNSFDSLVENPARILSQDPTKSFRILCRILQDPTESYMVLQDPIGSYRILFRILKIL